MQGVFLRRQLGKARLLPLLLLPPCLLGLLLPQFFLFPLFLLPLRLLGLLLPALLRLRQLLIQGYYCLRVFFSFEDGRKIMATPQWWQKYLGFYEIPIGTHLLLHYKENARKGVYLDAVEQI